MAFNKQTSLRVGVLVSASIQLLDVSPIDLFSMLTREYLEACSLPSPLVNLGIPVEIHYIYAAKPGEMLPQSVECTANAALRLTDLSEDQAVSPGKLDIVLIPGPDPRLEPSEEMRASICAHFGAGAIVMAVCTGIFPLAASGVLKGKTATAPRALVPDLRKRYPETNWVEKRWCRDGKIWTSGGITNGLEMVAAYLKETYSGPLSDTVCALADVGGRGQEYRSGTASVNAWWLFLIIRAWFNRA